MRRIHPIEPAPIGAEHLDWNDCSYWTHHDGLRLGLTIVRGAHCGRLQGRNLMRGLEGHRHALLHEQNANDESYRHEHVDDYPPHIEKKIADGLLRPKATNNRRQSAKSYSSGDILIEDDEENLTPVGEVHVPG